MSIPDVYEFTSKDDIAIYNDIFIHKSWFPLLDNFKDKWSLLKKIYMNQSSLIPSEQYKILAPLHNIKVEDVKVVWFEHEPNNHRRVWGGDTMNTKFTTTLNASIDDLRDKDMIFIFKCWSALANGDENDSCTFWYDFNTSLIDLLLLCGNPVKFVTMGPSLKRITSYIKKRTDRVIHVVDPRAGSVQTGLESFTALVDFIKKE